MNKLKKIHILILLGMTFNIQAVCAQTADSALPFSYLFQQSAQNSPNDNIYQKQILDRQSTLEKNELSESAYKLENIIPHSQIENLKTIERQLVTTDIAPNKWDNIQDAGIKKLDDSKLRNVLFNYDEKSLERNSQVQQDTKFGDNY